MKLESIIPFGIYNFTDSYDTYGYIEAASPYITTDGTVTFRHNSKFLTDSKWKLVGEFYSINPMIKPIAFGTKLLEMTIRETYPYDATDLRFMSDPYQIVPNANYFYVYNHVVPHTVPIYFYKSGTHILPSLQPLEMVGWQELIISPMWVMTKETVGDLFSIPRKELNFYCMDGTVSPWVGELPSDQWNYENKRILPFRESMMLCNENTMSSKSQHPQDLIDYFRGDTHLIKKDGIAIEFATKKYNSSTQSIQVIDIVFGFLLAITIVTVFRILKSMEFGNHKHKYGLYY